MKRFAVLAILIVVALAVVGVVVVDRDDDTRAGMGPWMMSPGGGPAPGWDADSWCSLMGARRSMMGPGSIMRSTWVADEPAYLAEMVAHHREAVAAAGELARSDRPEMREFAESIVTTQSAQIDQMTSWLTEWYPDQPAADDYDPMMRDLAGLSGDELDRAFLEDMITHHMAAVMMSQHLLVRGTEHEEVTELARSIRDDQHAEIIQMQQWLAEWYDEDCARLGERR